MVEAEGLPLRRLKGGPVVTGRFQQGEGARQVGLNKRRRAVDGAIHVAFGGQMHDDIRAEIAELLRHGFGIGDIGLRKRVAFMTGYRRQGLEITGIGQAIQHANFIRGIPDDMANHSRADKTRTTGDKNLHT